MDTREAVAYRIIQLYKQQGITPHAKAAFAVLPT